MEDAQVAKCNAEADRLRDQINNAMLDDDDDDDEDDDGDDDLAYPSLQQIKQMEQEKKQLQKQAAEKMTVINELKARLPQQAGYTVKGLESALATIMSICKTITAKHLLAIMLTLVASQEM
ncbi:uncharacterized protein [Ptychodera flava]|uniref:uncharacterized protein isoform X2 n=1 Tax=Ptychodera flava TaxID=63121 RepID=UPI003969E1EC